MLKLYNSLSRKKERFSPLKNKKVRLYTCGPTVYWFAHIGNLRMYIFEDILKRVLEYNGYKVKHAMNITDVGHLVSDQDVGEDKILLAAQKEKKTALQVARFYERAFKKDLKLLNIKEPNIWMRATQTINDQIELIKILEKKGFVYLLEDGVYFDTSKLKTYGRLWPAKMKILPGARIEVVAGKKNPTDFALWKFSKEKRELEWDSPWGRGFPGWHTECVVMAKKALGIPFDIHCGGIDHILIHHTNEIAQAEAAFGKILARFWLHGEFLIVEGKKMAKSEGNVFILEDLIKRKFHPLSFRYFCLTAHYRSKLNFTWKALESAQNALNNLYQKILELKSKSKKEKTKKSFLAKIYQKKFLNFINDDLDTPKALALMWELFSEEKISAQQKLQLLLDFDRVFGLDLKRVKAPKIPKKIKELVKLRELYRQEKKFKKADEIREKIKKLGFWVKDTKEGPQIKKI